MVGDIIKRTYKFDEVKFTKKDIRLDELTIINYSNIKALWYRKKSFWNYFTWFLLGTDYPGWLVIDLVEKVKKRKRYCIRISNYDLMNVSKTYLGKFHIF